MASSSAILPLPLPPSQSILVVRSNCHSTPEEREELLRHVEYNIFAFPASLVACDFLSDSGTSAMTDVQWAALMRGDEAYGRNSGYYCLLDAFRDIFERGDTQERLFRDVLAGTADASFYRNKFLKPHEGGFVNGGSVQLARPNFFVVPQGRCAETLLFAAMREMLPCSKAGSDPVIISNGFFDTTGANATVAGFELQTFTQPGLRDAFEVDLLDKENPFKGNLDLAATGTFLSKHHARVALLLITITNNFAAAQPVSMANIQSAAALAKQYGIPMFFDACRFAENARFIQEFEEGYVGHSIQQIIREMFSYIDGFTISLKKDGLANMGGALAIRDGSLFTHKFSGGADEPSIGVRLKERQILCYGNDSYGGMSGRDLMAAAVGLYETTKESFLRNRIGQVRSFARKLNAAGISILLPPGGHAIYLDMDAFFADCGRRPDEFASVGFTIELLQKYGIRAAEAGPFAWEWDKKTTAEERDGIPNLVRFAVPRNSMTDCHIDYTVAAIAQLHRDRHNIPGVEITRGKALRIRHFHCGFTPVPVKRRPGTRTFFSAAQEQLARLSGALCLGQASQDLLIGEAELSMTGWGDVPIPERPLGRLSNVGQDHSPIEYSVAIEHSTGKAQLRFLVESQPGDTNVAPLVFQQSALQLTNNIYEKHPDTVSLGRLQKIQDLFLPDLPDNDSFTAWHSSCASSGKTLSEWKIYLNPRVNGVENSTAIICDALTRLGLADSFGSLERMMAPEDNFVYFALDLDGGPHSRVKVYVEHPNATAAGISNKLAALCPQTNKEEIQSFCRAMSGGSIGPYTAKPVLTCFAFTTGDSDPEGTVHFPVSGYARDDGEIRRRIEEYHAGVSSAILSRYQRSIDALRSRPLEEGRGLHSWVSLKRTNRRGLVTTFYLSAELYGALPLGAPTVQLG